MGRKKRAPIHVVKRPFTMPSIVRGRLWPDEEGQDIQSPDKRWDAHVRLEDGEICIDVFDSRIEDSSRAHVYSMNFDDDEDGAEDGTLQLEQYGFEVSVFPSWWRPERKLEASPG